ncbi:MAG: LytTR family transcriptional regulator, partial [Bacteroidetes bacterium]
HTDFDLPLKDHKVVLRTEEGLSLISIQNIIRIEADRGYSIFYLGNGERIIVSQSLKLWDSMLNKYGFFRVHESHIVNLAFVKKFLKKDGGIITLKNGDEIYVARRRKEDLLQRLIELSIE